MVNTLHSYSFMQVIIKLSHLSHHVILLQSVYPCISPNNHVFKTTRKMNYFEEEELKDAIGKSPDVSAVGGADSLIRCV